MICTTWGKRRRGCGHRHQTYAAAQRCLSEERARCARQGRLSDRKIWAVTEDAPRKLLGHKRELEQLDPVEVNLEVARQILCGELVVG